MKIVNPKTGEEFQGNDRAEVIAWIEGTASYQPGDPRGLEAPSSAETDGGIGAVWGHVSGEPVLMSEETAKRRLESATLEVDACKSLCKKLLESRGSGQEEEIIAEVCGLLSHPMTTFEGALEHLVERISQLESMADDVEWQFTIQASLEEDE